MPEHKKRPEPPHVVVASVVERDGRFLMVEEHTGEGRLMLNQPAGHWEAGETLVEGALRECLEESAWEIEIPHFLGVYAWKPSHLPYSFVRFSFIGVPLRHLAERTLDTGIVRALWMTRDEVASARERLRSPAVEQSLDDYLAGVRLPLSTIRHMSL